MKIGTVKKIASVFKQDGLRAGVIIAIQRKRYWKWVPFGYYFQLGFDSKNGNKPAFMGWFEGTEEGEALLKDRIQQYFPGARLVPASEDSGLDAVLDAMEDLLAKSR